MVIVTRTDDEAHRLTEEFISGAESTAGEGVVVLDGRLMPAE